MHISIPISNTMEYFNEVKVSPLVSKVNIKVCYVGQEPNRNGTIITKETARKLGTNLGGVPIVGYFNKKTNDFEGHNREIVIDDEAQEFEILDTTKPYGFVDLNAKVWFEKFLDDGVEHEYLCTEGYIWTGVYPESERVIKEGNNQSMELNKNFEEGFWTEDNNSGKRIFIISDGLIEKLCILGQNVEPCFEGSQIKTHFSLEDNPEFTEFKATMFSMIGEIKDALSKGGIQNMDKEQNEVVQEQEEFAKKDEKETETTSSSNEDTSSSKEQEEKEDSSSTEDKEKKKKYDLSEVVEYAELKQKYSELEAKYSTLEVQNKELNAEIAGLRDFKLKADRKEKQSMIDSFYMLSDADKQDVVDNIDSYSLDDIEAKLSIICVRNKVNFNCENEANEKDSQFLFNLNYVQQNDETGPDWVRAVRAKSHDID